MDPATSTLIGHSLGAMVVTAIAATVPCRGVINVDQSLRLADFQSGLQQLKPLLYGDDASFRSAMAMIFDSLRGPLPEGETQRIESMRRSDREVVLAAWDAILQSSAEELNQKVNAVVGSISVKYLSLHGIDPGDSYPLWLGSVIRSASCEVWPNHGHYPHLVDQARFVARVNEFVAAA
jgi:pimeloyl-ACP methyl ester carboxylesterase